MLRTHFHEAQTILFVDDEPQACKWFARTFCGEFTILTAARSGETLGAVWNEIDLSAKLWTIPGKRMKGGRAEHGRALVIHAPL